MEKEFLGRKEAIELKELDFNEPCLGFYEMLEEGEVNEEAPDGFFVWQYDKKLTNTLIDDEYNEDYECTAPTFSQAFKWFREKHEIHNGIAPLIVSRQIQSGQTQNFIIYNVQILSFKHHGVNTYPLSGLTFDTYVEAELACLKRLIEIVKK